MKKLLCALLAVLMVLSLVACGGQEASAPAAAPAAQEAKAEANTEAKAGDDTFKVGMSFNVLVHPSYITLETLVREGCAERGWEYVCTSAQESLEQQVSDMEDLAAQGCDIIFVNCYDPDVLTNVINQVTAQGVTVVAVDNGLSDEANVATTIQADNWKNGVLVGNYVADYFKGEEIKCVVISGVKGNDVSRIRRASFIEGIIEEQLRQGSSAGVEIVAQAYTDWYADATVTAMEDIMSLNEEFNVVFAEADVMALECWKIIKDAGLEDEVIVVADADGQKEAFEAIMEDGCYKATGLNSFTLLAEDALAVAEAVKNGQTTFPYRTYTPSACVTIDNVDEYYDPNAAM